MGCPKQLLLFGDRPAVACCLASLQQAGIGDVVLVTGPGGDAVREAARGFPVTFALNRDPGTGMAGSVRAALPLIRHGNESVLVYPCDHPLVLPGTLSSLFREAGNRPWQIIIPRYQGRNGHPVIFPRALLDEIFRKPTLRHIIREHPANVSVVDTDDAGVVLDMDTPEEYRIARDLFASRAGTAAGRMA